jgi:hypothetical protein
MTLIRISSVDARLSRPGVLTPAMGLVRRASAVGLLGDRDRIERLDLGLLQGIARQASAAGVGGDAALALLGDERAAPDRLAGLIARLDLALSESPLPDLELRELLRIFDVNQLAPLAGVSPVSLRRYLAGSRSMPDALAARLHWLALVVADLAGAYNGLGIRRWFERPRAQLDGRSPRQVLGNDWDPSAPDVERVRDLAAALAGAGSAT